MRKLDFFIWILCCVGLALVSCATVAKNTQVGALAPTKAVTPAPKAKETLMTLERIADGYEVVIAMIDKERADLIPVAPGEIAKRIFCQQNKEYPTENVIALPEDDPAIIPFTKQFVHQSRGAVVKAQIIDGDSSAVRITMPGSEKEVYIRVLLAKKKIKRLLKDTVY